jgi:outer membrane protein assembly factor BamB
MKRFGMACLTALFAIHQVAAQQVEWRNDRTGIYDGAGLLTSWPADGPRMIWSTEGLGEGFSSVTLSADRLYLTGMIDGRGYLHALDRDGRLLAKREYGPEWDISHPGTRGSVIPDGGRLYVVSGHGKALCLDASTLNVIWERDYAKDWGGEIPKYGVNESPLVVGEKLILTPGGPEHNVVAVNKATGELIWSSKAMGDISSYCCPIYVDDQQIPQIVTITGHNVVGLDISNGAMLWSYPFTNRFFEHPNTPVYDEGMILCSSSYGVGSVMLRLTGGGRGVERVWEAKQLDVRTGHMVKIGDYAYGAGDYNRGWYCVEWKTGRQMYEDRSLAAGAVIAAGDMLYCYSDKGEVALVKASPEGFAVEGRFPVKFGTAAHWAHPVIHQGVMYVRHGDALAAYAVK